MFNWKSATHKSIGFMGNSSWKEAIRLFVEPSTAIKLVTSEDS